MIRPVLLNKTACITKQKCPFEIVKQALLEDRIVCLRMYLIFRLIRKRILNVLKTKNVSKTLKSEKYLSYCFLFRKVYRTFAELERNDMEARFKIEYLREASDFIESQSQKVRDKIYYNLTKSQYFMDRELFKKLDGTDIWEFRTLYDGICYRLLAFWDTEKDTLVIATHGFIKKTQKTPQKEIAKAEGIRKEYFKDK